MLGISYNQMIKIVDLNNKFFNLREIEIALDLFMCLLAYV